MPKMTKAQAKRMCDDARSKVEKLYLKGYVSLKDLESLQKYLRRPIKKAILILAITWILGSVFGLNTEKKI